MPRQLAKPAVASWAPDRLDVMVRADDGSLLHSWTQGDRTATVKLGGSLASHPVAVVGGPDSLSVFARSTDQSLLRWVWDPLQARMGEPEDLGRLATDPVAVSWRSDPIVLVPRRLADVLARSVDGPWRHWRRRPLQLDGMPLGFRVEVDTVGDGFAGDPVPVSHATNELDVFVRSTDNHQLEQWQWDGSALTFHRLLGGRLISNPVAVSWAANRIDVFARTDDGQLSHWGYDGRLTGRWFGPEPAPGILEPLAADPNVVSRAEDELDLLVRAADGTLQHWAWEARQRHWVGPDNLGSGLASDPVALWRSPDRLEVFARSADGGLLHWAWDRAQWSVGTWSLAESEPPELPWPPDQASKPDHLLLRPKDHVVLGVRWSGCQLVDGVPPALEPVSADARVFLTFPPQHVAEEVVSGEGPPVPTVDLAITSGFAVWRARLAGPSRLALAVDMRIELTAEGLLAALNGATVLPGTGDPADGRTAIELPWGLVVSPADGESTGQVQAAHPSQPVELGSGAFGLWRTRLGATDRASGLPLRALHSGGADPFEMPLSRASRFAIAAQPTPAEAARLELSSLGGSLSAAGRWESFEWDHEAILGRDQTVRTLARGVLYPLGHRAEYVELTERVIDPTAADPIAVLRKKTILTVTEPVRAEVTDNEPLARAFPFGEVEITTQAYPGLDFPAYLQPAHSRPTLDMARLESHRDQIRSEMSRLYEEVHGDMGWGGLGPVLEDLASERPEAAEYLMRRAEHDGVLADIEALAALGGAAQNVDVAFWPSRDGVPIRFPVRLAGGNGDVHIELPLIFVQDLRLEGDLRDPFFSLTDPDLAAQLAGAYADSGAGVVELPGIPIALVRTAGRLSAPGDVHEVHRLNLVPIQHAGGFRPRLGRSDRPLLPTGVVEPDAWGVEVALPAIRSLLGATPEEARVALALAPDYENMGAAVDVAFQVAAAKPLDIDFRGMADRAGGLVSPVIPVGAISRVHGLVNLAGSGSLDPAQLLGAGASLLGFDLRSLIGQVTKPPAIVTDFIDGQSPVVTMTWENVPLKPFPDPGPVFKPGSTSTLTMTVRSGVRLPAGHDGEVGPDVGGMALVNETRCEVQSFALAMPAEPNALLELSFGKLTFSQTGGKAPVLDVSGVDARFVGKLKLLQVLQEAVGLGSAGPAIDLTRGGITARYALPVPDVSVLAFTMRNLVFHAGVTVPFTGEPVSVALGFGSREQPFTLGVLMFGGGGYIDVELIHSGLRRLEISLEFGAAVAIGIGIATAEVHAMGGIRFALLPDRSVTLTGFLRIGGSVELLGLVSVSVELRVELNYQEEGNRLVGRARLVIEIDLTLYSDSIELDSGDWVIAGGTGQLAAPAAPFDAAMGLDEWARYRKAFQS